MSLLVNVFGYLSILLHGLSIAAQSLAVGGVLFLVVLVRPLAPQLAAGERIRRRVTRVTWWSALALAAVTAGSTALQTAVLMSTAELPLSTVAGTGFFIASTVKVACAIGLLAFLRQGGASTLPLLGLAALELAAATATTHAVARVEVSPALIGAAWLHQAGAAIWIGGLLAFLIALNAITDGAGWRAVGARFSRMSMAGVGAILLSGAVMMLAYVGSWQALYGTTYGIMVTAKIAMFAGLLGLGAGNFLLTERLRRDPATPVLRMKRFAEVELGIGLSIFFAAASLTSVPPAVDVPQDRVSVSEILDRNRFEWPALRSPDHDALAIPALQDRLDRQAAADHAPAAPAFVPGDEDMPPRNAADIAWSEFNHHWAGIAVGLIGLLVLLQHAGLRAARHWPLIFVVLGVFMLLRADPEVWPMGQGSFWAAWRDVEVLQHRLFMVLILLLAGFEWAIQTGRLRSRRVALAFPLMVAFGGALLLTHSHQIANVKDATLIEMSHTPLALLGLAAGWAAWLELRLPGPVGRAAGWTWGACFMLVGAVLLMYHEA